MTETLVCCAMRSIIQEKLKSINQTTNCRLINSSPNEKEIFSVRGDETFTLSYPRKLIPGSKRPHSKVRF